MCSDVVCSDVVCVLIRVLVILYSNKVSEPINANEKSLKVQIVISENLIDE